MAVNLDLVHRFHKPRGNKDLVQAGHNFMESNRAQIHNDALREATSLKHVNYSITSKRVSGSMPTRVSSSKTKVRVSGSMPALQLRNE